MRIFVTGATGWVGSAVVQELTNAGHEVSGLVRSEKDRARLVANGIDAVLGTLDNLDVLRQAAINADAVIHTAFNHDFSKFAENCEQDRRAIEAIGNGLDGTKKPLLVTSGVALLASGRLATEDDTPPDLPSYPRRSESAARGLALRGINAASVRLAPTVHGEGDHGFIRTLIALAKDKGVSAFIGDGMNRWPAVHRFDAAKLYRLALESGVTRSSYHAIAEEGIPFREIAGAIGRALGVPVESRAPEHFGWFAGFAGMDIATSSRITRELLDWTPTHPGLMADLELNHYF